MKEFFDNYGFWIYLGLTVVNYVFMYFRTKKTKWSSLVDQLSPLVEKLTSVLKKESSDSRIQSFDELLESQSVEKKIEIVNKLCSEICDRSDKKYDD